MVVMLVLSFFSWWYGQGWKKVVDSFAQRQQAVASIFSVTQLMRTLFAPWRRIITYPGASLQEKFRAWSDNLFSRVIGFFVRLLVLLAALVSVLVIAVLSALEIIIWPLLPLTVPGFLVAGLVT